MATSDRDAEFTDYVRARSAWLRRIAYLLCGDWHRADDLVQTTVTKLYVRWARANQIESLDGYVRQILVNAYLSEQRAGYARWTVLRRHDAADWSGAEIPDGAPNLDLAADLRTALAALPPRQRATVVLRYYCDLSVEDSAAILGCSPGTVKSQTARGLDALRRLLGPSSVPALEVSGS
jgi:RNA polymerase sigma-70 factor (sigma-E family)